MILKLTILLAFAGVSTLLAGQAAGLLAAADQQDQLLGRRFTAGTPGCVAVSAEPPEAAGLTYVSISNRCGKDIAAFRLAYRSLNPDAAFDEHEEIDNEIGLYPNLTPGTSDFAPTAGSTVRQNLGFSGIPQPVMVSITSVIFMDGSAAGDANEVTRILAVLRRSLASEQEQYQFCQRIAQYKDAVRILHDPEDAGITSPHVRAEIPNYARLLRGNDSPDLWSRYISKEMTTLARYEQLTNQVLSPKGDR